MRLVIHITGAKNSNWWLEESRLVAVFAILPQHFERVVGTYE